MCCRIAFTKPIFSRNEMKTATPPNGVTARCVSRRINRSSDNRAAISRGTGLSVAFDSIPLLSQILERNLTLNFGFPAELTSPSDRLSRVQAKMREYIENGAKLGWLLHAAKQTAYIYRSDGEVEQL